MNLSETFAREIQALSASDLTNEDQSQMHRLVLDHVGVSIGGVNQPWVAAVRQWAAKSAVPGAAQVLGSDVTVAPDAAALANGVAAHSNELDDTHEPSLSHPGCTVIPAALAVAGKQTTGGAFLAAVAAGYETISRLGQASDAPHIMEHGYHPTALFGAFGAASAAAKLLGLDVSGLLTSWGHALSLTGGAMQFSDEESGTAVKRMHAGYAARNGVLAAEMALHGVSAPLRPLDGKYGFLKIYGGDDSQKKAALACGRNRLAIHDVSLKPYSCCRLFHSVIDCLNDIRRREDIDLNNVESIKILGAKVIADQHMLRNPRSPMAAQYSLPYSVGATMTFGPTGYEAYEEDHLAHRQIADWSRLVQFDVDPRYDAMFPRHFATSVTVKRKQGAEVTAEMLDGSGAPNKPISKELSRQKLERLVAFSKSDFDLDAMVTVIDSLADAANLNEFRAALFSIH